ncbi:MAG TPA: tripartite tricarboxylate transporter permease [Candidatus Methylomirabilis sp.]|nr:tripartite tricarboxylate transporter permease [Candidatus Methylomirabilis sp.]
MESFGGLLHGFSVALSPLNLLFGFLGAVIGTIIGILPGLGPLGTMALLLSLTYGMDPVAGMILFAGIYFGAMYGGSTTSILLNIPGEAASVVTVLEGYKMARRGRAGAALAVAAVGSFIAGTISILGLSFMAPTLADAALKFGPAEYFSVALVGLMIMSRLTGGNLLKSLMMIAVGLALGTVGMETVAGYMRFTFKQPLLAQGIDFLPVAMGLFGISEVFMTAEGPEENVSLQKVRFRELWPTVAEWRRSFWPMIRGSFIGFFTGLIPGPSPVIATMVSYSTERRLDRRGEFGQGAIEGVAGPEAANNAAVGGAYVPLMALGIPFTPAMAVVMAVLLIHGISPGPTLISERPDLFWGVIASMYIGNFMLLVFNLPLVGVFANIIKTPLYLLMPIVLLLCLVGVYSINNSILDVWLMIGFGLLGYVARRLKYDVAPLVLALVLGPMMERSFREAMMISKGDLGVFLTRPLSAALLLLGVAVLALPPAMAALRARRLARSAE